jgi:hypothetical protein
MISATIVGALLAGCLGSQPQAGRAEPTRVTLVYSHNVDGEIEPCG